MCVTVRTLCLLVSSVSIILSVARVVIHDMLHLMVHQGCDPFPSNSAVSQNGHDVGASSRHGSGAVIRFALVSERRQCWLWILDTWENPSWNTMLAKMITY